MRNGGALASSVLFLGQNEIIKYLNEVKILVWVPA
jgi:hypothetical protein